MNAEIPPPAVPPSYTQAPRYPVTAPPPEGCARYFILGLSFLSPVPIGIIVGLYYLNKPDPANREFGKNVLKAASLIFVLLFLCLFLAFLAGGIGLISSM